MEHMGNPTFTYTCPNSNYASCIGRDQWKGHIGESSADYGQRTFPFAAFYRRRWRLHRRWRRKTAVTSHLLLPPFPLPHPLFTSLQLQFQGDGTPHDVYGKTKTPKQMERHLSEWPTITASRFCFSLKHGRKEITLEEIIKTLKATKTFGEHINARPSAAGSR